MTAAHSCDLYGRFESFVASSCQDKPGFPDMLGTRDRISWQIHCSQRAIVSGGFAEDFDRRQAQDYRNLRKIMDILEAFSQDEDEIRAVIRRSHNRRYSRAGQNA